MSVDVNFELLSEKFAQLRNQSNAMGATGDAFGYQWLRDKLLDLFITGEDGKTLREAFNNAVDERIKRLGDTSYDKATRSVLQHGKELAELY